MEIPHALLEPWMGTAAWLWLVFFAVVGALMVFDLGVLHRGSQVVRAKESVLTTVAYAGVAMAFAGFIAWVLDSDRAGDFVTGYVVEFSLSMDNVFVMAVIMNALGIPSMYRHRVLTWGIIGAIVLRGAMILLGATLVAKFHWLLYIFAAFLLVTGLKMLLFADHEGDMDDNALLKFLRKTMPITKDLHGHHFIVRQTDTLTGRAGWYLTPLLVTLIMIDVADVVFAVDSVPAIFAITLDPFIVFTSNIFAILGLRSLYFALAAMVDRFAYVKYALALVLMFIGGKILAADMFHLVHVPSWMSLAVTFALLTGGVLYSLYRTAREGRATKARR
jgi:tellurite resistance protein TerC